MGIAQRYSLDPSKAKDYVQDTFVTALNKIEDFKGSGEPSFRAWLRSICIRTALMEKRKWTKEIYTPIEVHPVHTPVALQQLAVQDILLLLEQLPFAQRDVFNLYIIDGYTHKEIAALLGVGVSTSRTLLTRARKALQKLLLDQSKIRVDESV